MRIMPLRPDRNPQSPRTHWRFRLYWRRSGWDLRTSNKVRRFDRLEDALRYALELQRWPRANGDLCARLDERDDRTHRWRERPIPELASWYAEQGSGWSK